ncbi:hypothetical protein NP493_69g05027 [Ridgeia piscesae]|uniref:Large ribosomal subunit protein bL32m n=1 Tax=Ridgeia piscesae TaxID=27915 RepID=A0AAD9P9R2_RIDPI|nr:hypothetical protein NP493_69g05027 [Ridgeia piscesae]
MSINTGSWRLRIEWSMGSSSACGTNLPQTVSQPQSIIDDIFGDGFFWAVPKARRSLERRRTRRNGSTKLEHWATPRKNIKECLVCGHWHLAHTICGNCYDKVRKETEEMRATMNKNDRDYNAPHTEVVYVYQGEEKDTELLKGKYVVEVDKPRPEWFSKFLLTKALGRR